MQFDGSHDGEYFSFKFVSEDLSILHESGDYGSCGIRNYVHKILG